MDVIPINEGRAEHNDLIITCQVTDPEMNNTENKHYGVEVAILANHSTVFADMLTACDKFEGINKITISESPITVFSFLNIIYGQLPSKENVWTFDLCIDLIEMGSKYFVESVIDRGVLQMCRTFEVLASQKPDEKIDSRYGKACVIKFFDIWMRGQKEELAIASFRVIELTFKDSWDRWLDRCRINCHRQDYYNGSAYRRISIVDFIDQKSCHLFKSEDLLFFQQLMEKFTPSNTNIMSIVKQYIWLLNDRPQLPVITTFD